MNPELLLWPERKARLHRILSTVFQTAVVLEELPEGMTFEQAAQRRRWMELFGHYPENPPKRRWWGGRK